MTAILAAWAAALAVWGIAGATVCGHVAASRADLDGYRRLGMLAAALFCAGVALQQIRALVAYELGTWVATDQVWTVAIGHRVLLSAGMLMFGYLGTRIRCGHRGWQAMAAAGVAAAAVSLAV
jgi:hypothetical protein